MLYKLYATHNRLSRTYGTIFPYTTDEMASKYVALALKNQGRDLEEFDLLCTATFDEETGEIKPISSYIVKLDNKPETSMPNSNPNVDDRNIYVQK